MPWSTPTLKDVRIMARDFVTSALGAVTLIPNSVLRIMTDAQAGLTNLVLLYIDWLSKQLLPDTAEQEWLDRHANIWLKNADGSIGRKAPAAASGTCTFFSTLGSVVVPQFSRLTGPQGLKYQTMLAGTVGLLGTPISVKAIDVGAATNAEEGDTMVLDTPIANLSNEATVVTMNGGTDQEDDDELRIRVLQRIQQPPMGGDAADFETWTLRVAGVTRAWASPLEQGMGTMTIRFMMDDLRADSGGFPTQTDLDAVTTYLDTVRPVAIKDRFIVPPLAEPIDMYISALDSDTPAIRAAIQVAVKEAIKRFAAPAHAVNGVTIPAQTIYAEWMSEAIRSVPGVKTFTLTMPDHHMPTAGSLGVLGSIIYG